MILTVHVKPQSHETKFIAWLDDHTCVIALRAKPIENAANIELIEFLSDKLRVAKTFIQIEKGVLSKVKHVKIPDTAVLGSLGARVAA